MPARAGKAIPTGKWKKGKGRFHMKCYNQTDKERAGRAKITLCFHNLAKTWWLQLKPMKEK
jgi:hypothetical protein